MDQGDVKHVVKRLLSNGGAKKQKKNEERLIAYVFDRGTQEAKVARFIEVLLQLRHLFERDRYTTRKTAIAFLRRVTDVLYERQQLALFLAIERISRSAMERRGRFSTTTDVAAHRWFMVEFLRSTGGSTERSIAFALFLLEQFGCMLQESYTFHAEDTLDRISETASAVLDIIRESTMGPFEDITPAKLWFERIVEEASRGNTAANEVLDSIISILCIGRPNYALRITTTSPDTVMGSSALQQAIQLHEQIARKGDEPLIVLPERHRRLFAEWIQQREHDRAVQQEIATADRVFAWFTEHAHECRARSEKQKWAIMETAHRWLRPHGFDHVALRVAPLSAAGVRSLAFYPEGNLFPSTKLHIITRKMTPHLVVMPAMLTRFHLVMSSDTLTNKQYNEDTLHELLECVVIDILWRIVTRKRKLHSKNNGETQKRGSSTVGQAATVFVPPHKRKLPPGQHASEEARAAAARMGWVLREGETFVTDYDYQLIPGRYADGHIVHALPTEPIAIYGDDDFMDLTDPT